MKPVEIRRLLLLDHEDDEHQLNFLLKSECRHLLLQVLRLCYWDAEQERVRVGRVDHSSQTGRVHHHSPLINERTPLQPTRINLFNIGFAKTCEYFRLYWKTENYCFRKDNYIIHTFWTIARSLGKTEFLSTVNQQKRDHLVLHRQTRHKRQRERRPERQERGATITRYKKTVSEILGSSDRTHTNAEHVHPPIVAILFNCSLTWILLGNSIIRPL
jgi:hypothetical protein